MSDLSDHSIDAERPYLLIMLGVCGLLGCASLLLGAVVAPFFAPEYDWIADTISDLAAGEMKIIMDVALYGFAAGLLATALAAAHAHLGGVFWSAGVLSLAILAGLVIVVGARDEYGDADGDGVVIHVYLVYALGALFVVTPFCMARGIGRDHALARRVLIAAGMLWTLAAPVFFVLPTGLDGLYERFLGLIACVMVATLAVVFSLRGGRSLRRTGKAGVSRGSG